MSRRSSVHKTSLVSKPLVNLHQFSQSTPLHNLLKKPYNCITEEDRRRLNHLATSIQSLSKIQDSTENTPLHYACKMGHELSIINTLLKVYPGACIVKNNSGCLPLHNCCKYGKVDPLVVKAVYEAYPEGLKCLNKFNRTPSSYEKIVSILNDMKLIETSLSNVSI